MSLGVVALLCGCGGDDTTDDSHPATTRVGDTGESTTSNDEGSSSPMTTETGATAPDDDGPLDPTGTTAPVDDEPFDPSGGDCIRVPDEDPTCAELGLPPVAYACFLEDVAPGCVQTRETYLLRCCPGV